MTIHLYAEHLLNIRAISIQASLSSASNKSTKATLLADGSTLTLAHDGEVARITLPIQLPAGQSDAALTIPAAASKDLSFRVQLHEKPESSGVSSNGPNSDENIVPWTAPSLGACTEVACRYCNATLVQRHKVSVWKDLPSENWAEMMDFWHCHKPHVPSDADQELPVKGYSAASKLAIGAGVGMVDPADLVLAADDCTNLKICRSRGQAEDILCNSCGSSLGHVHSSGGYKLRKMHLTLSATSDGEFIAYSADKWWACLLLSSTESQGVRKFTAQGTLPGDQGLKLWIFTPDVNVSTSAADTEGPMRAIKVFWRDCDPSDQHFGVLNRQVLAEGELELPSDEMSSLRRSLADSAILLPNMSQRFQDWHVAVLPRFTSADVAC